MTIRSDEFEGHISTGTIHVHVGAPNDVIKYSVCFSPDANHRVTHELEHNYAVFLKTKPSTCDCKTPEVDSSIVRSLNNGSITLCVKKEICKKELLGHAINQAKVDVFVNESNGVLELIGIRIPTIQTLD